MKDFSHAVIIGRFQPPHKAHLEIVNKALDKAENLIIVLGSHRAAPDVRNPWSAAEREQMLRSCLDKATNERVKFVAVRDQLYNDTSWMISVQQKIIEIAGYSNILLVGHNKDKTSKYLNFFPQWEYLDTGRSQHYAHISATEIRSAFFSEGDSEPEKWKQLWQNDVHENVKCWLNEFRKTDRYKQLNQSFLFYRDYRDKWKAAPFQPTFVTTDAVVIAGGHVLLVRRKFHPGVNLLALPGGFVDVNMTLVSSMLRELKSETSIRLPMSELERGIKTSKIFDHPERSLRGRTITHAFLIKLSDESACLPEVKGDTDASGALWMQLGELHLHEDEFFEDHLQIIDSFLGII